MLGTYGRSTAAQPPPRHFQSTQLALRAVPPHHGGLTTFLTYMSSTTTYHAHRAKNMTLRCQAPGCFLLRGGLDSHCGRHRSTYRRLGHPDAKPLPRRNWLPYKVALEHLFSLNANHAGLLEAEQAIDSLMKRGIANRSAYKGAQEMQRLATHGITPRDVLTAALAVLEYQRHFGSSAPDDRSRDFQIARAVLALAPQVVKTTWTGNRGRPYRGQATHSARVFMGKHLRALLSEFSATAHLGLQAQAKAASMTTAERQAARRAPMVVEYR